MLEKKLNKGELRTAQQLEIDNNSLVVGEKMFKKNKKQKKIMRKIMCSYRNLQVHVGWCGNDKTKN